ncbi:hypothetical protein KP509_19G039400 [Ceratopteris richardii]|uniref:AAA+ ATPase domain-containing protein n=1 Tax=Ceratopteris richardii TaxID=49495 RepID=A0A8T2SJG7_CERRI|nr:hypothetical protein KP509_19G039400 [Ceratopteris richardii]
MIKTTGRASQLWTRSERTVHIHLKKHLHLTNFIHLKYHSHMQKFKMKLEMENSSEMCLIRELSMLKKSRSLRDPSTSPSWKSGSFLQKFEKNHRKGQPRVPYDYQPSVEGVGSALSKSGASDAVHKGRDTIDEGDESSEREGWVEISPGDGKQLLVTHVLPCQGSESEKQGGDQMQLILECPSGGSLLHNWNFQRGSSHLFNVFTQGNTGEEDGPAYAHQESSKDGIFSKDNDNLDSEKDMSTIGSSESGIRSIAKSNAHKSKGIRGHSVPGAVHAFSSEDGLSWRALALLDRASANTSGKMDELEISEIPQNGCGIPWTWSGIHLRGKYAQDIAGRGVTCGLSGPLSKSLDKPSSKEQLSFSEESTPNTSEFSDSTLNTGSESFPLLEHGVQSDTASPSEAGIMEHIGHSYPGSKFAFSKRKEKKCLRKSVLSNEKSHQCLSEKYSPKSFQEIVGQALITQALSNALLKGKIASVYIFHGPQGTGKSSCARIFAVALNCKSVEEQKPCGSCSECLAFRYGNMSIVKEFAAGGLQGSKGMKKFIHEVNRTTSSRFRVYIVDECHVLSSQSWNAFMKNVEEVPKNIVFVLCTSSLEHLPHIVISRCQKFIFSKIKETDIIIRLQKIASQEGLEVDMEALKLVASASDGSLRDAEMMLEQLSLLGQKITLTMVQELMGLVSDEKLVDLLDFALSADTVNTVRHLKDLMISGVEPLTLMSQLACLITNILAGGYRIPAGRHRRRFFRKKHCEYSYAACILYFLGSIFFSLYGF